MDSLIATAARALAAGDPLAALKRVALRDDAPALALRGIAMAQLGDFARAKALLKQAARAFGAAAPIARARCIVAEAEVALASRDLGWPTKSLKAARAMLQAHGDRVNAAHAGYLQIRRLVLIGHLDDAERQLAQLAPATLPPTFRAGHELLVAGIAMRRVRAKAARAALTRARVAAHQAGVPALTAEVESAWRVLDAPAATLLAQGERRLVRLAEIEALNETPALIVDACRHAVRTTRVTVSLARRPVLFALAHALAEAWPSDVPRDQLIERAFGARRVDASHRVRLRVEIARLRGVMRRLASITATPRGFQWVPGASRTVVVLAPPVEQQHAEVLALLTDGEAWSSSALALALGASQRNVQRALNQLAEAGKVQSYGRGRARRWVTPPIPGITTILLLPSPLPTE